MSKCDVPSQNTAEEWEARLDEEVAWVRANREAALEALPLLKEEWPELCWAVRLLVRGK